MDFTQAEQQFHSLEARLQAGTLDDPAYHEALNALRVTDERGRVWMMQEHTGHWYVWENGTWQQGNPPRPVVAVPPPPPPVAPPAVAPAAAAPGIQRVPPAAVAPVSPAPAMPAAAPTVVRGANGLGFVLPLLLWALLFGALAFVGVNNAGVEQDGLLMIGGAALVALALILWRLTRHYEGSIERLRVEEVTDTDEDGSTSTKHVTYAYVRTLEGKVKKVQARKGYAQGDRLFKRKGDWNPRKVKM
ncbi:MAG: hypothetical protein R6X16_00295 [Anaerolineae bacterium]